MNTLRDQWPTFKSLVEAMQELARDILEEAAEASADLAEGEATAPRPAMPRHGRPCPR